MHTLVHHRNGWGENHKVVNIKELDYTDREGIEHEVLTSSNKPGAAVIKEKYKEENYRNITVYFD